MRPAARPLAAQAALVVLIVTLLVGCQPRLARPTSGAVRSAAAASPPVGATAAPTPSPSPLPTGTTVVIDPGHNGDNWQHTAEIDRPVTVPTGHKPCDTAGTMTASGYTESAYNLAVAQLVAPILDQRGLQVLLTRTNDAGWGPCIDQRVAVANRADAAATVSIHADGWPVGRGFSVLYPDPAPASPDAGSPLATADRRLAVALRDAMLAGTGLPVSTYSGTDGLVTVPWPTLYTVPEVLVETGNMRSPTDASLLESAGFRAQVAQAIADGIGAFLAGR
jgi:N-acetylmuramoyl-L-alanine amidase